VFPGGKGGRCVKVDKLPPFRAVVTKSGYLIFLESCGPVKACNGTALPFYLVVGSIQAGVSGFFIDIKSFRSHYGPGVDTVSNRNEYQECFLGVKAAGV